MLVFDFIINIVWFFSSPEITAAISVSGTYARSIVVGFNGIALKLSFMIVVKSYLTRSLVGLPVHTITYDCRSRLVIILYYVLCSTLQPRLLVAAILVLPITILCVKLKEMFFKVYVICTFSVIIIFSDLMIYCTEQRFRFKITL